LARTDVIGASSWFRRSFRAQRFAVAFALFAPVFWAPVFVACERTTSPPPRPLPPPPPGRIPASPRPAPGYGERFPDAPRPRRPAHPYVPRSHGPFDEEARRLAARFNRAPAQSRVYGLASYYGDSFAGRLTASGERYHPRAFTAAHRSLPFGSVVRVVREDSGQTIYVRINDRGPFVRGRVLDLSRAAAEAIDMLRAGVVRVRVELVERGAQRPDRPERPRKQRGRKHRKRR
jgi:rare lipoprotein A